MVNFGCSTVTRPPVEPKRTQALPEDRLGAAMLELAKAEGHRKAHPISSKPADVEPGQSQYDMLQMLRSGPCTTDELARRFQSPLRARSIIQRLERKGYAIDIERTRNGTVYTLTAEAKGQDHD